MIPRVIALALAFLSLSAMPAIAETVRIAHPPEIPPFIGVKDGKTVGLVPDILRAAAAREGIDLVFMPTTFAELQGTLTSGAADALAPFVISKSSPSYDFTTALLITGGALFVRAPSPTPAGFAALSGKTVVTPKTGPFVGFIQQNFPAVKVEPTADYAQSLDRVLSGQADAAALNIREGAGVVAASYAGKITVPTTLFQELPLGLAVIKGQHADLLKRLDAGLAAIRADGTLQRIEEKWKRPLATD